MAAKAEGSTSFSTANCTVCLEDLSDSCGRTVVTLRCSHVFHLDCIGSAYNMKGAMECPNCREVENGLWLCFVNESSDTMDEESDYDDDDDEEFEEFEEFEMPTQGKSHIGFMRRSNGSSGELQAGHSASSHEETRNSNPESSAALAEGLDAECKSTNERIDSELDPFFPDNTDPSPDV